MGLRLRAFGAQELRYYLVSWKLGRMPQWEVKIVTFNILFWDIFIYHLSLYPNVIIIQYYNYTVCGDYSDLLVSALDSLQSGL